MSGLSKVIVFDPDVRASRQVQLGFELLPAVDGQRSQGMQQLVEHMEEAVKDQAPRGAKIK